MAGRDSAGRRGWAVVSTVATDRILVGVCAAVWLVLLGTSVTAVVALVDLGRGFDKSSGSHHTPAVLYAVIIVSALVIAAAIPVLLRARRTTRPRTAGAPPRRASGQLIRAGYSGPRGGNRESAAERLTTVGAAAGLSDAEVDRVWLRGTVTLLAVMGVALIAVAVATYLMAVGHNGLAWTGYGIAGVVTATMPVLVWYQDRQLRRMLAGPSF